MDVHPRRRRRTEKIERRIGQLSARAEDLLAGERQAEERLARADGDRRIRRAQRRLERLRAQRSALAGKEIRAIMLALRSESLRTRERLDRELERLTPLEEEWERLRALFDALAAALTEPALDELSAQWQGGLEIPAFPVSEDRGYTKPFPPKAILF